MIRSRNVESRIESIESQEQIQWIENKGTSKIEIEF